MIKDSKEAVRTNWPSGGHMHGLVDCGTKKGPSQTHMLQQRHMTSIATFGADGGHSPAT